MGCLTAKASGEIASFINPTVTPIESARVYFSPIQSGEGTPSPENVREIVGRTEINFYHSGKNLAHIIGYSAINSDSNNTRTISNSYGTTINTTEFSLPDTKLVISQSQYPNTSIIHAYVNGYIGVLVDNLIWEQNYNVSFKVQDITSNPLNVSLQNIRLLVPSGGSYQPEVNGDKLLFKNVVWQPHPTADGRRNFEIRICGMSFTLSEFMVTPVDDENYDFKPYQGTAIPFSWKRLPDEYQEVEYIESDGGQYIDSGIECTNDLAVDFKIYYDNTDNLAVCGGIDKTNSPIYFRHHFSPTSTTRIAYWAQYNKNNTPSVSVAVSEGIHTIYVDPLNGIYIVDGVQGTFTPITTGETTGKSYGILGRIDNTGITQSKPSRFYYFKFYKNNQVIGNFIPCYRKSDNEIGMFDTVSQTFFTNQGTGTFTKGNDVFSDEVYGGYVDLVNGEIQLNYTYEEYTSADNWVIDSIGTSTVFQTKRKGISSGDVFYSNLITRVGSISASVNNVGYAGGTYLNVKMTSIQSLEDFLALLEIYPLQIVYKRKTPITHPLPDYLKTQLQTFKNENTFWSDADSVEIDYDLAETFDIQKAKRKIIMNQPHVETLTGDAVSFTTDMKAPLKECKVSFMPVQEGSGDPSPSNVRNITGWNGVNVNSGSNVYSIDWTNDVGTVYGGYVDLVSGELVENIAFVELDGSETWRLAGSSYAYVFGYPSCTFGSSSWKRHKSSHWENVQYGNANDIAINFNGAITIGVDFFDAVGLEFTASALKEYLAGQKANGTPLQIMSPLATPIVHQLTPQQILSFKGINNFNCGIKNNMSVKYWKHKLSDSTNIAYEAENLTFDGTNYIDTGVYLFSEGNINRDFEVVIEDLYGNSGTDSRLTIVCAKYDSTAVGFLIRLFSNTGTTYNGTIFMKPNNHNNITIKRINGVITIDGEVITNPAVKFTNAIHNHPLVLGCALEDNGTPMRYATGTIGHITVKWL